MNIKLASHIAFAVCLTVAHPSRADERQSSNRAAARNGVHDAGLLSLNFGPAILTSWKSAIFMEFTVPNGGIVEPTAFPRHAGGSPITFNRYVIAEGDKNFVSVKHWLHEHLRNRMNFSPNKPASGAFTLRFSYLLLFSSRTPPDFDLDDDGQPILFRRLEDFKNADVSKSLILGIPCTEEIFGWNAETARQDLDTLKLVMKYTGKHSLTTSGSMSQ